MAPKLSLGIDHVHVYVRSRSEAAAWYAEVLGMRRSAAYSAWAEDPDGPLTIQNEAGNVHLALFETAEGTTDVIAFGATGAEFLAWQTHLGRHGLELRIVDHELAFSLYFDDPDGNTHEITTYDVEQIRQRAE